MHDLGAKGDLKSFVKILITAECGKDIEKECHMVFPIKERYIRKLKVLKKPKFDVTVLMKWHTGEKAGDTPAADTSEAVATDGEDTVASSGGRYWTKKHRNNLTQLFVT